jgi:hypothetical protein
MRVAVAGFVVAVVVLAGGCTSDSSGVAPTRAPARTPAAPTSCEASARPATNGLVERQGVGTGASVWALFFLTGPGISAGDEVKVAWRMSGSGALSMAATGPGGRTVRPVWGPEPHGSSTWSRPGDEWGTGWVFPVPGCWTITLTREQGQGRLPVRVDAEDTP